MSLVNFPLALKQNQSVKRDVRITAAVTLSFYFNYRLNSVSQRNGSVSAALGEEWIVASQHL